MSNISNNIIEAISTIVDSKIKNLKLDKTVSAIIYSIEDASLGIYKIQLQDNIKIAYAIDPSSLYSQGDNVLVKIPENDMSNRLLIEKLNITEEPKKLQKYNKQINFGNPIRYSKSQEEYNFDFSNLISDNNVWDKKVLLKIKYIKTKLIEPLDNFGIKDLYTDKIIIDTLKFTGNYIEYIGEELEQEIVFSCHSSGKISLQPFYDDKIKNIIQIAEISCQPIIFVDFSNSLFFGEIRRQDGSNNKYIAKVYDQAKKDISNNCTFKWYYWDNTKWQQLLNQSTKNAIFNNIEVIDIKVEALFENHIIEIFSGDKHFSEEENLKGFMYSRAGEISNELLNKEFIQGLKQNNENYFWQDCRGIFLIPGRLYDYTSISTMIQNVWIDFNNRLHYTIKKEYNINNCFNFFNIINSKNFNKVHTHEIFFSQLGDQGTHESGYCCFVRPCDSEGTLTGSFFSNPYTSLTFLRALVFYNGEPISFDLLQEKDNKIIYDENRNIFISPESINILYTDKEGNNKNNFFISSVSIKNKDFILSNITPLPYHGEMVETNPKFLYYPIYVKYDKNGFNPIYNTYFAFESLFNETIQELESSVQRQINWNNNLEFPYLRFIALESTININNWNGQSISTLDNIIDSSQAGVGKVEKDENQNEVFTGMVLGVSGKNYGLYGYNKGENTVTILANQAEDSLENSTKIYNKYGVNLNGIIFNGDGTISVESASKIKIGNQTLDEYIKSFLPSDS